jgi:hypothetical protein
MVTMGRKWRRRAGQGAILALLLQLVLPLSTLHRAATLPGADAPFVICTSAGLVWIEADGTPARGGEGEPDAGHYCPVCLAQHLAGAAMLPAAPLLQPGPKDALRMVAVAHSALPPAAALPPLPARGPPFLG